MTEYPRESQLRNTGKRDGEEVVQLYVERLIPDRATEFELKGFKRVALRAGERRDVTLELSADQLKHWDTTAQKFALEPGKIELSVGSSSANLKLRKTLVVN